MVTALKPSKKNPELSLDIAEIVARLRDHLRREDGDNFISVWNNELNSNELYNLITVEDRRRYIPEVEFLKESSFNLYYTFLYGKKYCVMYQIEKPRWCCGLTENTAEYTYSVTNNKIIRELINEYIPGATFTVKKGYSPGYPVITFKKLPKHLSSVDILEPHFSKLIGYTFNAMADSTEVCNDRKNFLHKELWWVPSLHSIKGNYKDLEILYVSYKHTNFNKLY